MIHPTAIVEQNVQLGRDTSVWDNVHIRRGTTIGDECIVGGKTYIAYDVMIGSRVKINSMVYICHGITIEDGVMISAGVIFTNDRFPRAATADLSQLNSSAPDESTEATFVRAGATIGAGAIIGPGADIGRFAMVGMGAVVTKSVGDFQLVVGNPAHCAGCVCRCGQLLARFGADCQDGPMEVACPKCALRYQVNGRDVVELAPVASANAVPSNV